MSINGIEIERLAKRSRTIVCIGLAFTRRCSVNHEREDTFHVIADTISVPAERRRVSSLYRFYCITGKPELFVIPCGRGTGGMNNCSHSEINTNIFDDFRAVEFFFLTHSLPG